MEISNWYAVSRWIGMWPANELQNPQLSPTGQRAIFEFRGEILTFPKENGGMEEI